MQAERYWLRRHTRSRWRALAGMALLTAAAASVVLAALAGAHRDATSFDRLKAVSRPADVVVLPNQPGFDWTPIARLPEVAIVGTFTISFVQVPKLAESEIFPGTNRAMWNQVERGTLLSGRFADPDDPHEAMASPGFLRSTGYHLGDRVPVHMYSAHKVKTFQLDGRYDGPTDYVTLTGVSKSPFFLTFGSATPGCGCGIAPTNAFYRAHRENLYFFDNAMIRLRGGAASVKQFTADFDRITGRSNIEIDDLAVEAKRATNDTRFERDALLAFALAAGAAACLLIGMTVVRTIQASVDEARPLSTMGFTRRQVAGVAALGPVAAVVLGTMLGVAGAIALSPLFLIGVGAKLEPHPGITAEWAVLAAGALVLVAIGAGGSVVAAAWAVRHDRVQPRSHGSALASAASAARLPLSAVIGTRLATDPGRGRASVPVRPALVGAVVGVLGVVGAFTFRAGLNDAVSTPARIGQTWSASAEYGQGGDEPLTAEQRRVLREDHDFTMINLTNVAIVTMAGRPVTTFTLDPLVGHLRVHTLVGRVPRAADEVTIGPVVARDLHLHVGDEVSGAGIPRRRLRVVGVGFVPQDDHNAYDDGAWLTSAGQRQFAVTSDDLLGEEIHVTIRPGVTVAQADARLSAAERTDVGLSRPEVPNDIANLRSVRVLPTALGLFLMLLAIGAVGHALATGVRRRRRDLAIWRALGMTRAQTRRCIGWQATTIAAIGLLAGIPLGVVIGRQLWRVVADSTPLGYVAPLAPLAVALAVPVAVLIALLLAALPARRAGRTDPAAVLRRE